MNLYFISGLGADEKAFARIHLTGVNVIPIQWIAHEPNDTLTTYTQKLASKIDTTKPFMVIALSFGGLVAQELHQFVTPQKTILISSVTHHNQFPWFYQIGKLIIPLTPNFLFRKTNALINYLFGAKGKNAKILNNIMEANDPVFVKWCVQQLLSWRKEKEVKNVITIHGTIDKIIPYHSCDYTIENGSHFMVYTLAKEIESILQQEIDAVK